MAQRDAWAEVKDKMLFVTHCSQLRSHLQTGKLRPREATPQQHRTQGSDARFPLEIVIIGKISTAIIHQPPVPGS